MKHSRYFITSLWVSGIAMPSTGGDLIIVERFGDDVNNDWELVHKSSENWPILHDLHDLEMHGPEGEFVGPAVLVRSDGRSHVFRSAGKLDLRI